MRKKLLAFITVLALAVSAMGMTAFAAEATGAVSEETTYTLTSGSYMATTTANNGTEYTYNVELKEDGTYTYLVQFTMGETVYSNTESGTYKVEDSVATFTAVTSEIKEGEVYTIELTADDSFTWTRLASYFSLMSGKTADIAFAKEAVEDDKTDDEDTTDTEDTVVESAAGKYAVDISWIPMMDAMMDPVLEIDEENGTFKVYNATAPATSKGIGTVSYDAETGVYTLTYTADVKKENIGETTTYTYDAETDTITFTSALLYGSASFDQTDETTGEFITYTATLMKETSDDTTEEITPDDSKEDTTTDTETKEDTTTDTETKEETKEDVTADKNEAPKTADNSPVAFYAIAALAALGAAVVFTKKRNA